MKQPEEITIQTEFLRAFILECINQQAIKKGAPIFIDRNKILPKEKTIILDKQIIQNMEINIPENFTPRVIEKNEIRNNFPQPRMQNLQSNNRTQFRKPMMQARPAMQARPMIQPSPPIPSPQILGMEKINPILSDPSVISVECPGPGRQIIINKSGRVQTSSINLTTEEISKLMDEISKTTRIPVLPGIFKAAFGKYLISAVISDFVGTRFVIQKKSPFMPGQ